MINNKGMLLAEETLKIIVAVIAIGFLVYLLTSIYFSVQASKELEQAKETLPFIITEAKSGEASTVVYNPKNWWILYLDKQLCICEEEFCTNENKICQQSDFSVGDSIKIENPPMTLVINQETKIINRI